MEETLQTSWEQDQDLIKSDSYYMYTVRIKEGRPIETMHSESCFAVTGYTSQEFAEDPYLWIRMVVEEDRDLVLQQVEHIYSECCPQSIEHRINRKDGTMCWIESIVLPHQDLHETLTSYHGIIKDITERKKAEELIKDSLTKINDLNKEIVLRLTATAKLRDTETGAHTSRIGLYSNRIGEALNLSKDFVKTITFASQLHDIGKIGIPDELLLKSEPLTEEEFKIMKTHTTIGKNILYDSSHPLLDMAKSITLNHHERWDGTGYPRGIKADDIPIAGRIVNICDQYDALMNKRPYKSPFSHDETCRIITEGDGRTMPEHFDPDVLKVFKETASVFEEIYHTYQD